MNQKIKDLINIYLTFCKIGFMTFGGGLAMMPILQKELIEKRGWITDDDLLDYYAIGQSTPGIVAVNVSTFIGYKRQGIIGGIVGTMGIVTPSLLIICFLATLISRIKDYPMVTKALKGVNVSVASLLTHVSINFCKKTVKNLFTFIVALISFILVFIFKVPSFVVIILALLTGTIIHIINNKVS